MENMEKKLSAEEVIRNTAYSYGYERGATEGYIAGCSKQSEEDSKSIKAVYTVGMLLGAYCGVVWTNIVRDAIEDGTFDDIKDNVKEKAGKAKAWVKKKFTKKKKDYIVLK